MLVGIPSIKSVMLAVLGFGFIGLFIWNAIKVENIEIVDEPVKEENIKRVQPAPVTLRVSTLGFTQTYDERLQNTDTVENLLETLQEKNFLQFEKSLTTEGVVITSVNNVEAQDNQRWVLSRTRLDGKNTIQEEITSKIDNESLQENDEYSLFLETKNQ